MAQPYEPPRKGNSILDRLSAPQTNSDGEDSVRESFGGSRHRDDDLMLDVRLKDGSRHALPYGTLMKVDFNPADQLKLSFSATTVVIDGRRLLALYELLKRHRARFVQEGTVAEDGLKPEDAAHIESIHLETPEENNV